VIDGLAADCRFMPDGARDDARKGEDASPLSCASSLYAQSCIDDPCYGADQSECKPACQRACDGCAAGCATKCAECKKPCKDDACKRACATSCGACKQACLGAKDQCATGKCGKLYADCNKRLEARWAASGCPTGCGKFQECADKCEGGTMMACRDRCMVALAKVCPPPFTSMCMFNGGVPGHP